MYMYSPAEIARNYIDIGIKKVKLPYIKMFILGIYAGMFIASGGICSTICSYRLTGGDGRFISGLVFPIGLMLVLCAGAELFTGNCLLIIPLCCKKITIGEMLISWLIVYIGNFVGGIIMAFFVVYGHVPNLFENSIAQSLVNTATMKTTLSFGDAFVKGILCNFMVCLLLFKLAEGCVCRRIKICISAILGNKIVVEVNFSKTHIRIYPKSTYAEA